jgi:hypothetical protein
MASPQVAEVLRLIHHRPRVKLWRGRAVADNKHEQGHAHSPQGFNKGSACLIPGKQNADGPAQLRGVVNNEPLKLTKGLV